MSQLDTQTVKKRVFVSTSTQVFGQFIVAILGVVTLKMSTSYLGIGSYGVYATVLAYVSTFALLTDLGLNAINSREIAKRPTEAADIIGHNIGLRLALCCVAVPVIIGVSFILYPNADAHLRNGIVLLGGFLFFDAVRSVGLSYFGASVRGHVSAFINVLQQVLVTVLVLITVLTEKGYYGIILSFVVANIISMVVTLILMRKEIPVRPRINFAKWKTILGLSLSLGIIQLINMMYLKVDSLMLSVIKGTTAVGIYGIAYSLIAAFMMLPSFVMSALVPSMATAKDGEIQAIVQKAYNYMIIFAVLLAVGAFCVKDQIVVIISNGSFAAAATPFALLAIGAAFGYITSVFGFASVSLNKHHKLIYLSIATLVLNIVINFFLIPKYSYNGAAFATMITEAISCLAGYVLFVNLTGIRTQLLRNALKPVLAGIASVAAVGLLRIALPSGTGIINLIVTSIVCVAVYAVILAITKGLPAEIREFIKLRIARKPLHG